MTLSQQRPSSAAAFSLVEVIVGTAVLALILAPTFAVLQIGFRISENARLETIASQIITSEIENLRSQTYSDLNTNYLSKTQPVNLTNLVAEGFTDLPASFAITANFTTLQAFGSGNPPYGQAEVRLTVSYKEAFGRTRTISTYSRLSERGLSDYVVSGFN